MTVEVIILKGTDRIARVRMITVMVVTIDRTTAIMV